MIFENYKIETLGLSLSPAQECLIKTLASDILWEAPSESFLKISLSVKQGSFQVICNLTSSVLRTSSWYRARDFNRTAQVAVRKLHRKIKQWKRSRTFFVEDGSVAPQRQARSVRLEVAS